MRSPAFRPRSWRYSFENHLVPLSRVVYSLRITTPAGLMEVDVPAGSHHLQLARRPTRIERTADLVSLAALFTAAVVLAWNFSARQVQMPDPV